MATSVFADHRTKRYTRYHAELALRDRMIGGIPRDPKLVEGWIKKNMGVDEQEELLRLTRQTLVELGVDVAEGATADEMQQAADAIAGEKKTIGFKRNGHGLYVESRQVKAMIKEVANILWVGEKLGARRGYQGKRAVGFIAERVFVEPGVIPLGRDEPDGIDLVIGHVNGPRGPQSTVGYVEYVDRATVAFDVVALNDCLTADQWADIWVTAEMNGLGAMRSQGYGTFDVTAWEKVR